MRVDPSFDTGAGRAQASAVSREHGAKVHPDRVGIGLDEETAVVIRGGEVAVLGNATVTVARPDSPGPNVRVYRAGSRFPRPTLVAVASR